MSRKKRRKTERLINIISVAAITASAVAVITVTNTAGSSEYGEIDTLKATETLEERETVAGISPDDIRGETGDTVSENESSENKSVESVLQQTSSDDEAQEVYEADDETKAVNPLVVSKEYNNVASGKLEETSYVKSDYFENTLFLGDSRTVALKNNGFIAEENTFAVNGISHLSFLTYEFTDSVTGVTGDIFTIVKARKPERIYVALGVNGVAFIDKSTFAQKYNELIDGLMAASPDSIIVIQCILPVNESTYTGTNKNLNNGNIDAMNKELLRIAEEKEVFYLDISDAMKDSNNQLLSVYDSGDGIHFSFTGYSVVYDGICRHGVD